MNSKRNRVVSGLLSFVMIFTLVFAVLPPIEVSAAVLTTPTITSPDEDNTYYDSSSITFKWSSVTGATYYKYAIKDMTSGELLKNSDYYTSKSVTLSKSYLEVGHEIKFTVGAYNDDGEASNWATVYITIEEEELLAEAVITSPSESKTYCYGDDIKFSWKAVSGATYYKVAVRDTTDDVLIYNKENYTSSSRSITFDADEFEEGHTYKFAVGAYSSTAEPEEWGIVYITIEEAELLDEAEITSPLSSKTYYNGDDVVLSWESVSGATYYKVAVRDVTSGDNNSESTLIYSNEDYTSSSRSVTIASENFEVGHTYKFAVGAYSDYSEPVSWGIVKITIEPYIIYPNIEFDVPQEITLGEPITWTGEIDGNGDTIDIVTIGLHSPNTASIYFRQPYLNCSSFNIEDIYDGGINTGVGIINSDGTSPDGTTYIDLDMSTLGTYTVTVYARTASMTANNENPIQITKEVTVVAPEIVVLDNPDISALISAEAGKDATVSWGSVYNADYYTYELYDITNGLPGEHIGNGITEDNNVIISGNDLLSNHTIIFYLTANSYSGSVSEKITSYLVVEPSTNSITASDEEILISSSGGSDTITVYSSGKWTARKSDSWFSINKTSGNGEEALDITVEKNTTSGIRIGSIKLQDDTGEYYVIVQQAAQASSEFFNKIRVIFDSSSLTISEDDIFTFSGSAYNTEVDLDKIHVSITKADEPDVGIDYFRMENIGNDVFAFSDIPSFYANETLEGLMVTNTQEELTLEPGESYHINIWVTDEDGYSSGKITKIITISESVEYNIDTPTIDNDQLTNTCAYIEATILEAGVNSINDYGFNILSQSGERYQQYSLWQSDIFKDVTYNKKSATFSINASDLEAGTTYYVEAFVIDSEGNVSFSNRANFTTKSAGVTITQPSNNKVYAANTTSIEFAAEVIGSGYSSTTFKIYDYDMNATGYVFTSSGNKPSATWNISGVDKGTYYVQAETLLNDGTVTRSEYIKFDLYIPVSSITIKDDGADTITVGEGEQRKVTATVTPSYATNKKISWITNNKNIATVDKYGVVSGISDGTTVLVAKDETGTVVDSCTLVVTQEAPDVEELDEFEFSMGDTTDSAVLVGPTIEFAGESFSLFEFPLNFDVPGTLWEFKTKYNEDSETVQLILGRELCESIEIHQEVDDLDAYWKETYAQLKGMMNSFGMKTSRDFYNKFRKLKSDIRNNSPLQKANLGFEFDTELYGYIELNKNLEFVEGAIVLALSTELSVSYPLPPAPVVSIVFSIAADAQGKLMLVPRSAYYSGYDLKGELSLGITPGIAANIDVKAAEAEAKIDATLQFNMDLPLKSLEESLTISIVNAKLTLSYQMLKFINGEKVISLGDDIQLYPNTSASQLMMTNTFALFQEEIDSSSEMQLIDTRNSASTYGRMMFALNSGINEVFAKIKDEMIDETVYCYEPVDLVQLDDGREFAVWVKTDTQRNVANETILYWSTKKNGVWEAPKIIHDDGTADFKPILAKTSDGNVHLIWQNSVKEFNEDVTLDEMGAYTELYHSIFNGIAFSTPTMITTNTDVMCNLVEVNTCGNDVIVAWSESNIETDTSTVKYITYSSDNWSSPQIVINDVAIVEDLASGYINTEPVVAVKYDKDPLNTDSESILAYYKNGTLATIDNSADACNGLYIIDGIIYYLDNNTLHSYNGTNIASEGITVPDNVSNYQLFINDSGISYVLYTASSGKYNNIFTHARELNGEWTSAVQLTDYDMKLYSISGIQNNGELDVAYVLAADDDSNGYPTSNLYFTSVSNKLDICITESYYDTDTVLANGIVPLTITVKNNSLQTCDAYNVRIHDQNGYIIADTDIASALEPGQISEITLDVQILDRTKDIALHVTADDSEGVDVNRKNNTVYINIPLNDLVLTYKDISKVNDDYIITVNIENQGINTITDITAALYEQNNNGNTIDSVYIDEIEAGGSIECKFLISSQYFMFTDDTDLISFYVNVTAECSELSYENNSKILIYSYEDITALEPEGSTVSGTITSYLKGEGDITVQLLSGENIVGSTVVNTYTEVNESKKEYSSTYSIPEVVDGTYTLRVSKANHVTRDYTVTVNGDTVADASIHPIGDVNLDGKVNGKDVTRLRQHVKTPGNYPFDDYTKLVANVNGDTSINGKDVTRLRQHVKTPSNYPLG